LRERERERERNPQTVGSKENYTLVRKSLQKWEQKNKTIPGERESPSKCGTKRETTPGEKSSNLWDQRWELYTW